MHTDGEVACGARTSSPRGLDGIADNAAVGVAHHEFLDPLRMAQAEPERGPSSHRLRNQAHAIDRQVVEEGA